MASKVMVYVYEGSQKRLYFRSDGETTVFFKQILALLKWVLWVYGLNFYFQEFAN